MIEKNNENSPKSDSSKLLEEDEIEIPNFKLLYRNTPNPERDKSSGVSSDEETTSSSLVPLPNTLNQMRNKSKWTLSGIREQNEKDTTCDTKILRKSAGDLMTSLEELRKKYTLKNETSVTMKMNSANLMLDDILNSSNMNATTNECPQSTFFIEQELRAKTASENESLASESVVSQSQPCHHYLNHSHVPMALDFLSHSCHLHCSPVQPLVNSFSRVEDSLSPKIIKVDQRRKTLMEKFQDLQIKYRIQSVYKMLQKNPFGKSKKELQTVQIQQGIPDVPHKENRVAENETVGRCEHCKCPFGQYSKKMILDLIECSETSQSENKSTKREERNCTCSKQRECDCPEIIPKCSCAPRTCKALEIKETPKQNSLHSECPGKTTERLQATKLAPSKEDESNLLLHKENKDNRKKKTDPLAWNNKGWKKYCTEEKNLIERTDIYYFDHGNSAYYQTTDNHPMRYTECLVERTDEYATKFWAEIFGTIEIGVAFLISFILQFYRFLFTSVIRSLSVGLIQIFSDYFFKPLLTILFNGIIQPCLILAYNIATSLRDLCLPISQIFGFFAKEIANILRSCRLVEINKDRQFSCNCENKAIGSTTFHENRTEIFN